MASFSEELEIYLAEASDDEYVPPIYPRPEINFCELICRMLRGEFGFWPNPNLCEPLRRYLRRRRGELVEIEKERVKRLWDEDDKKGRPRRTPCPSRYVAEERDIRQWLLAGGDPCNIQGLMRACDGIPWYYDFTSCRFTDGTGNPIQEPPMCIPELPGVPGNIQ